MAIHTESLVQKHCVPCHGGVEPLRGEPLNTMLRQTPQWTLVGGEKIVREVAFKNYAQTLAFVNRVAELAQAENHHPEIAFTYNKCRLELQTHAIGGLSENDFILAAKIDEL